LLLLLLLLGHITVLLTCELLLQMEQQGLFVCLSHETGKETTEPIEMLFGIWT